jgi:hypothetical protein
MVPPAFNLFRLQWFPDYPLTKKAIEDGYITEEDASIEKLIEKTTNDWAYVPQLVLKDKKTTLSNVIWLIVWGHTSENITKYAVFNDSIGSKLCIYYLNFKAVLFGKIVGVGGLQSQYLLVRRAITAIGFISRGEVKGLIRKTVDVIKRNHRKKEFSGHHKMTG